MKRRKKLRLLPKVILLILVVIILFLLANYFKKEDLPVVKENNLTYQKAIESGLFKEEYSSYYNSINYIEEDNFINTINSLLGKKYTPDEINNIYEYLGRDNIDKILNKDYIELSDFLNISNFDVNNYERYVWALDKKETPVFKRVSLTLSDIVTFVNIGLDNEFYSVTKEIEKPDDLLVLVNKYNKLPSNYAPNDLVSVNGVVPNIDERNFQLRKEAAEAFTKLVSDAYDMGHTIFPYSAYRSYNYQTSLYNNYVNKDGQNVADTYSARPGFSEHQLGLAVDVRSAEFSNKMNAAAFNWVSENASKYGFIIRYPEDQIDITGYIYEDWHLRYLSVEIATDVKNKNITYDEYYDLYVK